MSAADPRFTELHRLCEALCEGLLSDVQAQRLQDLVRADRDAAWFYVRFMDLHAALERQPEGLSLDILSQAPALSGPAEVCARSGRWPWLAALAVAVLVVILGVWFWRPAGPTAPAVAWLTQTIDCRWPAGATPSPTGTELRGGDILTLEAGIAELTLVSGVRLSVTGPVGLELTSVESVLLQHGQLTASVPENALGFSVRAPGVKVVDLGTDFGVQVSGGTTEVHVFQGKVRLELAQPLPAGHTHLEEDQAIRINPPRGTVEELAARPAEFGRDRGLAPPQVVLREDFAGPLAAERWTTRLPVRQASLEAADGILKLRGRAHLVSARPYDPVALGGLRVSGKVRFVQFLNDGQGNFELFDVLTRSTGLADERTEKHGQAAAGIRFRLETRRLTPTIEAIGPELRVGSLVRVGSLRIQEGDTFRFEVMDDGRNLAFKLTDLADPANTATTTAVVTLDSSATDHVVIHNREGRHVLHLSELEIATSIAPPPPSEK
ncbi:MAG: FecR domain-containing protein [Planctomycetia bacterium]|nr:FecR domain-containing protein [Planctomycetia bacterium]